MKFWSQIKSLHRNLRQNQRVETQLDEELRSYIDMLTEERIASGMSAHEARRTAMLDFGGIEQVKQTVRDHRVGITVERIVQEVRYGFLQLRRDYVFTLTVILMLALAIGANTAIFSVVNALMLKSLPYAQPDRVGTIYTQVIGAQPSNERHQLNGEQWELLRDRVPSLISAVSSTIPSGVNLQAGSTVRYLHAGRVSAHYFDVLAIQPILGRSFSEAEDCPHGPNTAILSYDSWHNIFGSDPNIVGKIIQLKGAPYDVIGVLPNDVTTPLNADLYTALQLNTEGDGEGQNVEVITRLRDGRSWDEADAEIGRAWSLRKQRYELKNDPNARVSYYSVPLQRAETATLRPQTLFLMLAAVVILLIACANLAGLTLVRLLRRAPENATRLALGASLAQLQRQLWIENLMLALPGGVVGILVGFLSLRSLLSLLPKHFLPMAAVTLDGHVLAFTTLISLLTCALFGMLPAITIQRLDLRSVLIRRAVVGGNRPRLRQTFIVCQVALTFVLLYASGLLIRTLIHLQSLPAGFNPEGIMTAKASLDDARYHDPAAFRRLLNDSLSAMQQIPGVQQAAVGLSLPYERSMLGGVRVTDGKEAVEPGGGAALIYVTPGYFETLQIPVLTGRCFTRQDAENSQHVVLVNQAFARRFFHGANPVGRHLNNNRTVVGMVEDVVSVPGLTIGPLSNEEAMYIPASQLGADDLSSFHAWFQPSWIIRTLAPSGDFTTQMQQALATVDSGLPFSGFYSMPDLLANALAMQRVEVALLCAMAALALLLSAVGIFALVANIVAQKTREIGLRIALGSTIGQAMAHAGGPGMRASSLGVMVGLAVCTGALRAMRSVLYGVDIYDLRTILGVTAILAIVTLLATLLPTLRIAGIDPATTLREE